MGMPPERPLLDRRAPITVDELLEIHRDIKEQAAADRTIHYSDIEGRGPSIPRLQRIVDAFPPLGPEESAAWIVRAIVLVQPFPDGNHRAAIGAAELVLRDAKIRFTVGLTDGAAFQREVSAARRERLQGYDDAPLAVLAPWDDSVMACCVAFVRAHSSTKAPK